MNSLAERLIKPVRFTIAGESWPLLFTYRAIGLCEDITGIDMLNEEVIQPSATMLRALLFSALSVAGAPCTLAQAGNAIAFSRLESINNTILSAWDKCMPEPEPAPEREEKGEVIEEEPPPTWLNSWAIAREDHKLTADEWLDLTPRQMGALRKRRLSQLRREELLMGILNATVENYSFCAPKQPVSAELFMLHPYPKKPKTVEPEGLITGEHIHEQLQKLTQM